MKRRTMELKKYYIAFALGIIGAFIIGIYLIVKIEAYLYESEVEKIESNYRILKDRVDDFTQEKDTFIQMIAQNELVKASLISNSTDNVSHAKRFFYNLLKGSETIMQLRLLDLDGMELIRLNRTLKNEIVQIKNKDLQDKSHRDYFKKFLSLNENVCAFSDLDLNMEENKIEIPWRPTLRMGMPVFIDGKRAGVVVINYAMQHWLNNLSTITFNNFYLVDKDGYFILHPQDSWKWSRYQTPPKKINEYFTKIKNIQHDFLKINISDNLFIKPISFFNHETMYAIYEPKEDIDTLIFEKGLQIAGAILLIFMLILLPVVNLILFFIHNLNEEILERMEAEEQLELYKLAVEQSTSSIYITNSNGIIQYANPHFYQVTGYRPSDIIGRNPEVFRSGEHSEVFYEELWESILSGNAWHGEIINQNKNGELGYAITSISPIKDAEGKISHFVTVREDITELKDLQAKLTYKANYDALTNIPNRHLFFERLKNTLAIAKRKKHAFSLLFIDLDGFKKVNDNFGHDVGDKLLIHVAQKLQECIREIDTVARVGGDEFIILLNEIESDNEPSIIAQRIIDKLSEPFEILGHSCHIGASIGISIYPKHSSVLDELLALADKAMYKVKSSSKNNYYYAE